MWYRIREKRCFNKAFEKEEYIRDLYMIVVGQEEELCMKYPLHVRWRVKIEG
jgi:hypothetical protein